MGILSGNPKDEPMHYGEVYGVWSYLVSTQGCIAAYQTLKNHAGDGDLRKLLQEAIEISEQEKKQLEEILKENGVALPPAPPARPEANLEDIPPGARFNDPEIGMMLGVDAAKGLVAASGMMGQAIREDIGALFAKFHLEKAAFGVKVLELNKNKGWLMPPPLHVETPEQE